MKTAPSVLLMVRDRQLRDALAREMISRDLAPVTTGSYDAAIAALHGGLTPAAIVVQYYHPSVTALGSRYQEWNQWLTRWMRKAAVPVVYLRRTRPRIPPSAVPGAWLKLPMHPSLIVQAVIQQAGLDERTEYDALRLDIATQLASVHNGPSVHLTRMESQLLGWLQLGGDDAVHRHDDLLTEVWRYNTPEGASVLIRAHTSNLRKKLRDGLGLDSMATIRTVKGHGYAYVPAATSRLEAA